MPRTYDPLILTDGIVAHLRTPDNEPWCGRKGRYVTVRYSTIVGEEIAHCTTCMPARKKPPRKTIPEIPEQEQLFE